MLRMLFVLFYIEYRTNHQDIQELSPTFLRIGNLRCVIWQLFDPLTKRVGCFCCYRSLTSAAGIVSTDLDDRSHGFWEFAKLQRYFAIRKSKKAPLHQKPVLYTLQHVQLRTLCTDLLHSLFENFPNVEKSG